MTLFCRTTWVELINFVTITCPDEHVRMIFFFPVRTFYWDSIAQDSASSDPAWCEVRGLPGFRKHLGHLEGKMLSSVRSPVPEQPWARGGESKDCSGLPSWPHAGVTLGTLENPGAQAAPQDNYIGILQRHPDSLDVHLGSRPAILGNFTQTFM